MKKYRLTEMGKFDDETGRSILLGRNVIARVKYTAVICKHCRSSAHVVRYGTQKGIQQYYCKKCKRKFADNAALSGMRTPTEQVSSALSMFYEGMSLSGIRRHLQQTYYNYPADAAVYGWIVRFTQKAVSAARTYRAHTGNVWIADETVLKIGGSNMWFWDIIDDKTRFLLASHISTSRTTRDAETLMLRAARHATKIPNIIITDKLRAYLDGIERVFGADTRHILSGGFRIQPNTNLVERFHSTLKGRTSVMRGMQNRETARLITNGWLVHYNFFRPHEALGGRTPAQAAGIRFPYANWAEVVRGKKLW